MSAGALIDSGTFAGYTIGMKTAISIPDELFADAERLARRTRKSRSQLFSDALKEYVARHAPDNVTDALNRISAELQEEPDEFIASASRRVLERSEW
jgi:metal-responsive CopG/Arc/MetJ family transcriptional regulator